jgi:hypothetical protein
MKTLYNIFLIFLIGFFSSSFLFNLSPIDYKNTIVIDEEQPVKDKAVLSLSLDSENTYTNPDNIVISHMTNLEIELLRLPKDIVTADVYRGDELIKSNITNLEDTSISINDSSYIISPTTPLQTTINISQEKLGLSDGKYKIVLKSGIIENADKNSVEVFIEYDTGFTYYEATNAVPIKGSTGLVLYFTNKELNSLIPVSRFSTQNLSVNKQVIYELQQGPKNQSLSKTIDAVNLCFYRENDRAIFIDLPADNTFYNNGSAAGTTAYISFVKSMFYLSRYYKLDYVKFTVDRKTVDTYFHGLSISDSITKTKNPVLYYGVKVEQRLYLIEHELFDFDMNADIKAKSQKILELYKSEQPLSYKNPLPNDLILNNASLEKDTLSLDFNEIFITAFAGDQNKNKFMIDALVYSFTSVDGVKSVKFTVNGNPIENFIEGKDMKKAIVRPLYINPEDVDR